jgi:putative membrane protein
VKAREGSNMRFIITTLLLASSLAFAQDNNPAAMSPNTPKVETGKPAAPATNNADQLFVRQAALGGQAEVELAKLADRRAQDPAVKDFAHHMIEDHGKANDRLTSLAKNEHITLRSDWDTDHKVIRDQLSKLNGAAFDDLYIRSQIADHQKTAQLLEWHISSAQSESLKGFSVQTLPTVLDHLQSAQEIQARLASTGPVR